MPSTNWCSPATLLCVAYLFAATLVAVLFIDSGGLLAAALVFVAATLQQVVYLSLVRVAIFCSEYPDDDRRGPRLWRG